MLKALHPEEGYEYQSKLAKQTWKASEKLLPKPPIKGIGKTPASQYLTETLQYARGAESRGEYVYRKKYLLPLLKAMVKQNETASMWEDPMGNIIVHMGENPWDTLHAGHIDSIHLDEADPYQEIEHFLKDDELLIGLKEIPRNSVPHIVSQDRWVNGEKATHEYITYKLETPPRRCLGADDGCAVAIMLYLIGNQVEGTYAFFRGEERGCVGSSYMLDNMDTSLDFRTFKRAIEVDRMGQTDIVYKMSPGYTASETFAKALAEQLDMGHEPSTKGSITDVGYIAEVIPECVNVAAGYGKQHTPNEYVCPAYLDDLSIAFLEVDWNALPSVRAADEYVVKTTKQHPIYLGEEFEGGYNENVFNSVTYWGDHTVDKTDCDAMIFQDMDEPLDAIIFVARNARWIVEALASLDLTYSELHSLAIHGLCPEIDIADFIAEPMDDDLPDDNDVILPTEPLE